MVKLDPVAMARSWADQLPSDFARRLAGALREGTGALLALQQATVLPISSNAVRQARELNESGQGLFASGFLTALLELQPQQTVMTPVWTGPESDRSGGRLTLAVLADLISEARHQILLVSYATLPSIEIRAALASAVERGVEVTALLESTVDNPQFRGRRDPFAGLPMRRLSWPGDIRPAGASMHAKMLVVDRRVAVIGSANLTGYGLERNIECGLLVRGGPVPGALADHLLHINELQTES
jgi:phosphatidylserine/phosphatidylglycerophosphate/cardiolipin synthase-like enzyme